MHLSALRVGTGRHDRVKRPHLPHLRPLIRKAFSRQAWPVWAVIGLVVLVASFWALWFPSHVSQVFSALVAPLAVLLSAALVSLPFRGATWLWRGWSVFRNVRSGRNSGEACHIHIHVHITEDDWLATESDATHPASATESSSGSGTETGAEGSASGTSGEGSSAVGSGIASVQPGTTLASK